MTLKELAEARQISVASAARLMRRRKCDVSRPGNDGHIRVLVPADEQEPKVDARPDVVADIRADVMEVIRPLQDAIAALRLQLDEANARALWAEQAVAGERAHADVLRDRIEALQGELRRHRTPPRRFDRPRLSGRGAGSWRGSTRPGGAHDAAYGPLGRRQAAERAPWRIACP